MAGSSPRRKRGLPDLDPKTAADTAARQILAALGDTIGEHERAILAGAEGDVVHDLRVAVRRARTLLGQLRSVFPRSSTKSLRDGLRYLGEISGPARDLDILAQVVRDAERDLSETERDAFDSMLAVLRRDRAQARQTLLDGLVSKRRERLAAAFTRFAAPAPRRSDPTTSAKRRTGTEAAPMPIEIIAAESIERAWKRLVRHGRALDDASPAEALHRVRIDGKKLRYLLELFRSVYPGVELGPVISSLKDLQNCLGAINDATVQDGMLRSLVDRLKEREGDSSAALVLAGRLIERAKVSGATGRRRFPDRFVELRSKKNRKRIKSLAP